MQVKLALIACWLPAGWQAGRLGAPRQRVGLVPLVRPPQPRREWQCHASKIHRKQLQQVR